MRTLHFDILYLFLTDVTVAKGMGPLHCACEAGNIRMIEMLLFQEAVPTMRDKRDFISLAYINAGDEEKKEEFAKLFQKFQVM